MKILNHPACTHQLGAPSDMQDGSCDALPVMYQDTEHGTFAVSFWQPEPDDLAELLAGGGINLWVRAPGRQHPVVMVGTFPCPDGFEASGMQMEELAKRWYGPVREQLAQAQEENKALREQVAQIKGEPSIIESFDDLLAAACIAAEVPDSKYEAICIALTEILGEKGIQL